MIDVKVNTEIIKLDAFLKWCGAVVMGSEAKTVVQNGEVKLNGEVITMRGKKLKKGDIVEYNSETYKLI